MDPLEIVAENLRALRLERGLSQERLAELSDLHMTDVGRIERAARDPGVRTLAKLARGLGVPIAALVAQREDSTAQHPGRAQPD
jgi:transcriptional regulator with XRE-family HTH domain